MSENQKPPVNNKPRNNNSGNSTSNSTGGGPNKNKNNKRRYYNKNKKRNASEATSAGAEKKDDGHKNNTNSSANKKRHHSKNKNNKNRNNNNKNKNFKEYRGGADIKNLTPDQVTLHYDYLLDLHLQARTKHYELFFRADPNQKKKLEKKFMTTLYAVRDFEKDIKPENKVILEERINGYPEDRIYTLNHDINPKECDSAPTEIYEIHVNEVQRARPDYSEDEEESSGSMEEYYKFKGLPMPVVAEKVEAPKEDAPKK
jgi:hypothetical protein